MQAENFIKNKKGKMFMAGREKTAAAGKISVREMTAIALVTAVTCILGPMSLPIVFSPVPITLTNLVLYLSLYVLKTRKALISYVIYWLLGTAGLPVFSGFAGGLAKAAGPTGGYLIGFIFMIVISGWILERFPRRLWIHILAMAAGTAVCYLFGTIWLVLQMSIDFKAGLAMGVLPYLPGDAVKILIAATVGPMIAARIRPVVESSF